MVAIDKSSWQMAPPPSRIRYSGFEKHGITGDHRTPTPYSGYFGHTTPAYQTIGPNGDSIWSVDIPNAPYNVNLINDSVHRALANKAWEKLFDKVRDGPANLGETIAQGHQAFGMIADRFGTMYRSYRDLKRGRFRDALRKLSTQPKRKHKNLLRSSGREASNLWLEYYFGWKPLIQDVYDACTLLSVTVPHGQKFRARKGNRSIRVIFDNSDQQYSYRILDVVTQGGEFLITNPNLFLLQQAGVANPALLAWNLTPFSFLVDWVFDVSSFIGGYSDTLGLSVTKGYTSYFRRAKGQWRRIDKNDDNQFKRLSVDYTRTQRVARLTQPVPNSQVSMNLGTSMKRAATAASLLGQILL